MQAPVERNAYCPKAWASRFSPSMLLLFKKYNVCKKNNGLFVLCYMASLCILFTKSLRY